jgi:sialic acid synthase SpsE
MPIIAEIGQNHCGDLKLAIDLIGKARDNGASLAKFQLYDSVVAYGSKQESELTLGQAEMLVKAGERYGIPVFFSVFDIERLGWCIDMRLEYFKIAYSQRNNLKLIEQIPEDAMCFISCKGSNDYESPACVINKLFCISKYPADPEMFTFPDFIDDFHGYSDHTVGLDCAKLAIARGAYWIEKHFSIDNATGVDAQWSMTPDDLKELVRWEKLARCL